MQNKLENYLIFLFFLLTSLFQLQAENTVQKYVNKGDSLFTAGKYTEAFEVYDIVLEKSKNYTPQMLLKMAYVKEGLEDYTEALYYLNLYYYHHSDERILQKMYELAETHELQGYKFSDYEYFVSLFQKYFNYILLATFVVMALMFVYLVRLKAKGEDIMHYAVAYSVVLALLFYVFNYGFSLERGIIKNEGVYLMNAPSAGANQLAVLEKGHRVKVLDKKDIWSKIEWNGESAYIRESNLLMIH